MKKLTNYTIDLGRAVAFYPELKKITHSIKATLLLCQLLYWNNKGRLVDGWIYKTSNDIEIETGLTYYEQTTARKKLLTLGILVEKYKRLDHEMWYRIDEDKLNSLWENMGGYSTINEENTEKIETEETSTVISEIQEEYTYVGEEIRYKIVPSTASSPHPSYLIETIDPESKAVLRTRISAVIPVEDPVAEFARMNEESPGILKLRAIAEIREKIQTRLNIIVDSGRWNKFLEFAYIREKNHNEPIDTFLDWMKSQPDFNAKYWSPERMKTMYPQAFLSSISESSDDGMLLPPPPKNYQERYTAMPKDILVKKSIQSGNIND